VAGKFKTEAIVLRSIRYGEADRVLHLYSSTRGRIGAIAKGSRRPRSRFGGRLEPFFRLQLVLYEGRGDLATVTSADTVAAHAELRSSGPALTAAARACDSVLRLLDSEQPNLAAYNLLARYLTILDGGEPGEGGAEAAALDGAVGRATALAFRLKLALAAGYAPELAGCARCGEPDGLSGFSGDAGGVVCGACERATWRCDRPSGRSARRSSTTPTCSCARRPSRFDLATVRRIRRHIPHWPARSVALRPSRGAVGRQRATRG
jgi:DNA repair protein RecO (recombination protein O)